MNKLAIARLISFLVVAPCALLASTLSPQRCEQRIYTAPDGRLTTNIMGRVARNTDPAVGFELVHGQPLIARPRQLVGFSRNIVNELSVKDEVKGISVDQAGQIILQSVNGFQTMSKNGFEPNDTLTRTVHGRLFGSGNQVFVEVRERHGVLQFIARKRDGTLFPIASVQGPLRAASWNDIGLAAVVGDSLYVWQAGVKTVVRLLTDRGLSGTQDVVLVGSNRAVVTLRTSVVLVSDQTVSVVMGMPRARCRFQGGVLYLLDGQTGMIWSMSGVERLGTKNGDQAFAMELLKRAPNGGRENSAQFLEAARIIGCEAARRQLSNGLEAEE